MPLELETKNNCCGCSACKDICSVAAISMNSDNEGFSYPVINNELCISCELCKKVCPISNESERVVSKSIYAFKNDNLEVRKNSSSGGAFSSFAEFIINNNGVVYGCVYNENIVAVHTRAENQEQYRQMRGSKYVQSNTVGIFHLVEKDLMNDRYVLFSGTPCQMNGLNNYLSLKNINVEKLFTVDFVCHGVASPMLFNNHIELLSMKNKSQVVSYYNRFKKRNNTLIQKVVYDDGKVDIKSPLSQAWKYIYQCNTSFRPSCENCKFASETRCSDITLGDYHGKQNQNKKFHDCFGLSVLMINTEKGEKLFSKIENANVIKTNYNDLSLFLSSFNKPVKFNENKRNAFWNDYYNNGWKFITEKYGRCNTADAIKNYILDGRRFYSPLIEKIYLLKK